MHSSEKGFSFCLGPPDIETGQVEETIRRIDRSLEQRIIQGQGQGCDSTLGDELIDLGMDLKEARRIERQKDGLLRKWPHLAFAHPDNGCPGTAFLVRNPGEGRGN